MSAHDVSGRRRVVVPSVLGEVPLFKEKRFKHGRAFKQPELTDRRRVGRRLLTMDGRISLGKQAKSDARPAELTFTIGGLNGNRILLTTDHDLLTTEFILLSTKTSLP